MSAHLNPSGPVSLDKNINLFYIVQIFNVEMFNLLKRIPGNGIIYIFEVRTARGGERLRRELSGIVR